MDRQQEEDIRLLKLIAKGSQSAFNQFYESHISFVLHVAIKVLQDRNEAEDVCHDIFLEVYQKPLQYQVQRGSIQAWLAVKTRNRCIDRLRKRKPVLLHKLEQLHTIEAVKTEVDVLSKIENKILLDALKQLPQKQQEVIYGAYFEGKTQVELSQTLNKPLGSIKSSIRYGLQNLRKQKSLLQWAKTDRE
ncbi:sigma-70 family RNA polymerase sigma factor [Ornithinibacillus sp. L9]|uniref:Sigma-70 family RNA polymerase sigma factor n=1 Tax=Ornithinibacillus caprae TaxID=2678566 RepID=A0A6N8FLB4_9BACI|nr:sigma-70 family RNA polymerase sigma factor [Ornithinibacillus caprae]MUK88767.1 sigma-70 family RNA polymerase sigma factor [Ornithinibacillus caprae]